MTPCDNHPASDETRASSPSRITPVSKFLFKGSKHKIHNCIDQQLNRPNAFTVPTRYLKHPADSAIHPHVQHLGFLRALGLEIPGQAKLLKMTPIRQHVEMTFQTCSSQGSKASSGDLKDVCNFL